MALPLIPLLAAAAVEAGPVLSAIGGALLGGSVAAGVASIGGEYGANEGRCTSRV